MTPGERMALLAYARWWVSRGPRSPLAQAGLELLDGGLSGQRYLSVHRHDYLLFPRIAESLAYEFTDGPESEDDR